MSQSFQVRVPDIGDFEGVEVIEVLVEPGDRVEAEASLVTIESDKASMEIPSPAAGTVRELHVKVGATVSEGSLVATLEVESDAARDETADDRAFDEAAAEKPAAARAEHSPPPASTPVAPESSTRASGQTTEPAPVPLPAADLQADVVVLGAGPGGYTAAFRAADLGLQVVLVDKRPQLGGVCLNVGCIPSKAMLHAAAIIDEVAEFAERGIAFGKPKIDLEALDRWKSGVVGRLTKGLAALAKQRGVEVVEGAGVLEGPHLMAVTGAGGIRSVAFRHAILAAGSRPVMIPGFPSDDERLWTSDDAIRFERVPKRLLVIGGGIIGLEMAQVYSSLGSAVTVVELLEVILPGVDRDLVRPLERRLRKRYENIYVSTKVTGVEPLKKGLKVALEGSKAPASELFDAVLVAVGRRPNGDRLDAQAAGVEVDERGFVAVDAQQRTNVPHIFAIGDLVGPPMLAHKATHEGKVAAEVISGGDSAFDARVIPSVAYTDPEVAWVGITEEDAQQQGIAYDKGSIPWTASGRALGIGRSDGLTKALFDRKTGRIIGVGIVGPHAGDLISEAVLAIEMGAEATDIGLTIHPHPTLSETLAFAAEAVAGTLTDLYLPKKS